MWSMLTNRIQHPSTKYLICHSISLDQQVYIFPGLMDQILSLKSRLMYISLSGCGCEHLENPASCRLCLEHDKKMDLAMRTENNDLLFSTYIKNEMENSISKELFFINTYIDNENWSRLQHRLCCQIVLARWDLSQFSLNRKGNHINKYFKKCHPVRLILRHHKGNLTIFLDPSKVKSVKFSHSIGGGMA